MKLSTHPPRILFLYGSLRDRSYKFTVLLRDEVDYLTDRHSERKAAAKSNA